MWSCAYYVYGNVLIKWNLDWLGCVNCYSIDRLFANQIMLEMRDEREVFIGGEIETMATTDHASYNVYDESAKNE